MERLDIKFLLDHVPFPISQERLVFAEQCRPFYEKWYPEILEEIKGIADGQNVEPEKLEAVLFSMYCIMPENKCSCFACNHFQGNTTAYVEMEDGINEYGLAIGLTSVFPKKLGYGLNAGMLLRYGLEKCRSVNEFVVVKRSFAVREIRLYANIGGVGDVPAVLQNDAAGIGLFRSEFLYLGSETFPTEEEQFRAYRSVVQTMAGKKVIIRTLDISADKQVDYFHLEHEDNPAMGYRAIRICLQQPDIFKTQLRALFRASYYGNIGVMIETPAAVWMTEELGREVDFFSIGTNDLTQYTLAIDRQNPRLDSLYDPHHPALLRAIQMTVENGHKGGAWVGICEELGADTTLTETFLRMGVDKLSVSPSRILTLRSVIRNCDLSK